MDRPASEMERQCVRGTRCDLRISDEDVDSGRNALQ